MTLIGVDDESLLAPVSPAFQPRRRAEQLALGGRRHPNLEDVVGANGMRDRTVRGSYFGNGLET
jgi:hypothetical protein